MLAVLAAATPALNNGLYYESPPMGWRSWNAYHHDIDQEKLLRVADAVVARRPAAEGTLTSLRELGYALVGIDGGWSSCGKMGAQGLKPGGKYHGADGKPLVDTQRFPDLGAFVREGHEKGVRLGWYHNVCECAETELNPTQEDLVYRGDVDEILRYGFDSVKFDGCGQLNNMTKWATLLNASSKPVVIENCHWGYCDGEDYKTPRRFDGDDSSCPERRADGSIYCPFHFFRTSMDINDGDETWVRNLLTATRFLDADAPLAGKGCWAYPDMLEVGYMKTFEWNRAHFGAWCIMSAPLVLGFDLLDEQLVGSVWEIISNAEAIEVNQRYAGHPGRLVRSWTPPGAQKSMDWPAELHKWGGVKYEEPLEALQLWAKPQPEGAVAILVINVGAHIGLDFEVSLAELGLPSTSTVSTGGLVARSKDT